jgi:uncharacterized protein (DUF305 family)
MSDHHSRQSVRARVVALIATVLMCGASLAGSAAAHDDATPAVAASCQVATPTAATPAMNHGDMAMDITMDVEFDQLYIDMMIPHHGSIVALAEFALPELTDPRLIALAHEIIDTQPGEQDELRQYRKEFYGSPDPMPLDDAAIMQMMMQMPSMTAPMVDMGNIMSAEWQISTFCAADDPDIAFIEQTIPHHEMAIQASEDALTRAVHPEIAAFAQRVIEAQQAEIDQFNIILAELTGTATPVSYVGY